MSSSDYIDYPHSHHSHHQSLPTFNKSPPPTTTTTSTDHDVYLQYKEALNDLNQNSKPVIIALTMLADDYKDKSKMVVKSLDEYINKVSPELKLLGLYLIDSIIKNLKQSNNYIDLFQEIIVRLFTHVFLTNDEPNRKALYKLRHTWTGFFTQNTLNSIDKSVNNIDPAWPMSKTSEQNDQQIKQSHENTKEHVQIKQTNQVDIVKKSILKEPEQISITQSIQKQKEQLKLRQMEKEKKTSNNHQSTPSIKETLQNKQEQILKRIKIKLAETSNTTNASKVKLKYQQQQQQKQQQQQQQQQQVNKPNSINKSIVNSGTGVIASGIIKRTQVSIIKDEKKQQQQTLESKIPASVVLNKQQQVNKVQELKVDNKLTSDKDKIKTKMTTNKQQESSVNIRDPRLMVSASSMQLSNKEMSQSTHNEPNTKKTIKRKSSQLTEDALRQQQQQTLNNEIKQDINDEDEESISKKQKLNDNDMIFGQEDIDLRSLNDQQETQVIVEQSEQQKPLINQIDNKMDFQTNLDIFKVLQGLLNQQPQHEQNHQQQQQQPMTSLFNNILFQQQQQPLIDQIKEEDECKNILDKECELNDLPAIKLKDYKQIKQEQEDSLLLIDGRSYRIRPNESHKIRLYYNDYDFYCNTLSREILINNKCVYKMGELTKDVQLKDGRKVRLMYMGKRIELWLNSQSYQFRYDSPPKLITINSSKYYVKIDSRNNNMYFNDYLVCNLDKGLKNSLDTKEFIRINNCEYELTFICPPKYIMIDDKMRMMRYDLPIPCVQIDSDLYIIKFTSKIPRKLFIDSELFIIPFNTPNNYRIKLNGRAHEVSWGGPGFELIIDGRAYELQFNTQHIDSSNEYSREIYLGGRSHIFRIYGDIPDVRICGKLPKSILDDHEKQQQLLKEQQQQQQQQQQTTSKSSINVQDLVGKLFQHGLLPKTSTTSSQPSIQQLPLVNQVKTEIPSLMQLKLQEPPLLRQQQQQQQQQPQQQLQQNEPSMVDINQMNPVPDLTSLDINLLKQKYDRVIFDLYSGLCCSLCGMRFKQSNQSKYSQHLDWHYRQNKKEKEEFNVPHNREYYYDLHEWLQYEELSQELIDAQNQAEQETISISNNDQHYSNSSKDILNDDNTTTTNNTCPVSDDIDDKCCICNDPFEIYWDSTKEEWRYKDAIKIDSSIYHPVCYEDAKEDPTTPYHNNHISIQLNDEKENSLRKELSFNNELN